jgi:hypothetical protein
MITKEEIDIMNEIIHEAFDSAPTVKGVRGCSNLMYLMYKYLKAKESDEIYCVKEASINGKTYLQFGQIEDGDDSKVGFDEAIKAIKEGKKAKRKSWKKEQHIEIAYDVSYNKNSYNKITADYKEVIAFIGTSGVQSGWLASQADMLAEDWIIF